ncbi:MAG: four helix bundle protein [Bacillota bacterium]
MNSPLSAQSIAFSIDMVNYYKWLTESRKEYILSKQILRSATSVGANLHEAQYAVSKSDFVAKMQISLKEASETEYWLIVLEETGYLPDEFLNLKTKCLSLKRMLVSALNTAKAGNRE